MLEKVLKIVKSIDSSLSHKELEVCHKMIDNLKNYEGFKGLPIVKELRIYCLNRELVVQSFCN